MLFLALGQTEFDLGESTLREIDAERDEREALLLSLAKELVDLLAVEKQFPGTERLVIHNVAVTIEADVAMVKKRFASLHAGITILQVHAPLPDGFDLGTLK